MRHKEDFTLKHPKSTYPQSSELSVF